MAALDAEDIARIEHLDFDLLRRRIAALAGLPMARGSGDWGFVCRVRRADPAMLTPEDRHRVALLCWVWRRRGVPRAVAPRVNPADPLSPDNLALAMGCMPILAGAKSELGAG